MSDKLIRSLSSQIAEELVRRKLPSCPNKKAAQALLRNMDFTRDLFDRPLERMSQGQKKKLLLARSLCIPAHVYIWDEPLNYIDVLSRVQLEGLLTEYSPTMLLVEHDAVFLERVCTGTLDLDQPDERSKTI